MGKAALMLSLPRRTSLSPAIDVVLALGSLDGFDPHGRLHPDFHQGPDTVGGAVRGGAGFAHRQRNWLGGSLPTISAGLGLYGAGWSALHTWLRAEATSPS